MTKVDLNEFFSFILGKTIQEARKMIGHSYHVRIMRRDGVDREEDGRYIENRVNVEINNQRIVNILGLG